MVPEEDGMGFMMPAFSPNGKMLAPRRGQRRSRRQRAARRRRTASSTSSSTRTRPSSIRRSTRWCARTRFPADNAGLGYPSFTPDSKWIAYHTGEYSTGCHDGCEDDAPRRRRALDREHGRNEEHSPRPHQRSAATPSTTTRTVNRRSTRRSAVATRGWCSRACATGATSSPARSSTASAGSGSRPSTRRSARSTRATRRLHIEGQEDTPNMRGFWALAACIETPKPGEDGGECKAGFECCSGFCVDGVLHRPVQLACAGAGEACEERRRLLQPGRDGLHRRRAPRRAPAREVKMMRFLFCYFASSQRSRAVRDRTTASDEELPGRRTRALCSAESEHSGQATYYDFADGSGACSFEPSPNDLMVAAMNAPDYAGAAACGSCARVFGPNGEITVRIVDLCPECPRGQPRPQPRGLRARSLRSSRGGSRSRGSTSRAR